MCKSKIEENISVRTAYRQISGRQLSVPRMVYGQTSKGLEVSEELGIGQSVISRLCQRFQDDGNVSRCYSTGRPRVTMPNEDRYLAVTLKGTDEAQRQTCLVSSLQLPVRQFQCRPCIDT
ncbi:uncharacterized protein TNCV_4661091 [Trichonephila clavipes]|uniref:Paired domain-containing protein n=1 Tax=Trichonephila clavipes TaxID=2585209 RepID=A0A8X6V8J8_TRICX|nr:uncharacterized protein TNCV_4661091 [Trichonephila clavipes]